MRIEISLVDSDGETLRGGTNLEDYLAMREKHNINVLDGLIDELLMVYRLNKKP